MSDPILATPEAFELVLQAVVEACLEELVDARRKLASTRAAAAADLEQLQAVRAELAESARLLAASRQALETTQDRRVSLARENCDLKAELLTAREALTRLADQASQAKLDRITANIPPTKPLASSEIPAGNQPGLSFPRPNIPKDIPSPALERGFRKHRVDLTGVKFGSFVGISPTSERRLGSVVWLFRCVECRQERLWTAANLSSMKNQKRGGLCECQGGAPRQNRGRVPVRLTSYKPETDGLRDDEDLTDLDAGDTDGLLDKAMRLAEGDDTIRSLAARVDRPRPRQEVVDGEFAEVGEDSEALDEDEEDEPEELDFEEATG